MSRHVEYSMLLLPLVLLGASLVDAEPPKTADLKNCTLGESLVALGLCTPKVKELKSLLAIYKGRKPPAEVFDKLSALCEQTTKCLGVLECKDAREAHDLYRSACEQVHLLAADLHTCVPKFYTSIYEKLECTKKHDYFAKDFGKKRVAFTTGKQCFVDFAKANCSESANKFLDTKYDKFLDAMTIAPLDGKCQGFIYEAESHQCKPVMMDFEAKGKLVMRDNDKIKINDSSILEVIQICKEVKECISNSCKLVPLKNQFEDGCLVFELANTEFFKCIGALKDKKSDVAKYKCLAGFDHTDKSKKANCAKFTEHKECIRELMAGECGEKSVVGFDENVAKIKKMFKCGGIF